MTPKNDRIVALVTGSARRVGRAIAEDLARRGYVVAIHCNGSRPEAEAVAQGIRGRGGSAAVFETDLRHADAAGSLATDVTAELGPVRLLVNNASVFIDDSVGEPDWAAWEDHFTVHLKSPVALIRQMAQHLPSGQDGLVVNMIDQRVERLTPRFFSYTLSKSALWTATRTMAQALAPRIRVNAIGPGPTLANERQDPADFQAQIDALLLKRGPDLAEFGATIDWLWHARSVTGQMIALDGGQHLAWETPDVAGVKE